jgi:hypothetical protein
MGKLATIAATGADLAIRINAAHRAANDSAHRAIEQAYECGHLLNEAKVLVGHGEWLPWLEANTEVSPRQSQKYMRLAANWDKIEMRSESSHLVLNLEDALKLLSEPRAQKPKPALEPEPAEENWAEAHTACGTPLGYKVNVAAKPDRVTWDTQPDGTKTAHHNFYPKDDELVEEEE